MANSQIPITAQGEQRMREELEHLKTVRRPAIIKASAAAREHGDLKENAEYHAAREQQGFVEARIRVLESQLLAARVIDVRKIPHTGRVIFGATVHLEDGKGKVLNYQIVSEYEADAENHRISAISPLARALIGREEGEQVEIEAPSGTLSYTVVKVHHI